MKKKMLNTENGSITIFVLVSILFFLIVVFSVYMNSSNRNTIQVSEIDKVKEEYEQDVNMIDEIYEEIASDYPIEINLDKNGGTYTILAGNLNTDVSVIPTVTSPNEDVTLSLSYQFLTSETAPAKDDTNWKPFNSGEQITEAKTGGTWYLYIKVIFNSDDNIFVIRKSDPFIVNYQIVYNANGGTGGPTEQIKTHGESLTLSSETPSREHYKFLGWSTVRTDTTGKYSPSDVYTDDKAITLYAIWEVNSYTLTFDSNGGSTPNPQTITKNYGLEIGTLPTTSRTGYTFNGWYTAKTGGTKIETSTLMPGGDTTYYAQWTIKKVTVTFMRNTSSSDSTKATQTFTYGVTGQSFSDKGWSRSGYILLGWSTNRNATSATYSVQSGVTNSWIDSNSPSITLYAIWKANPQVTSVSISSSITVVAGNRGSFTVSATGNGTLSYQWYYNTTDKNTGGTAISGATSRTYSFTPPSTSWSGRYYYCVVTSTVGNSTATKTSSTAKLTVLPANYSTLKSGTTTYYNTLNSAISGATSGGGDSGGGTITVLNTLTDNSSASTSKTIAINTNGKTITRNQSITTTRGTLTIKGTGSIYCTSSSNPTIICNGGNLSTSGGVLLKGYSTVIKTANTSGNINLNTSYVYSLKDTCIYLAGSGTLTTYNSYIYVPCYKPDIYVESGSTKNLTFTGGTRIGNGSANDAGINGDGAVLPPIRDWGTGTISLTDRTWIMTGPYGKHGIWVGGKRTLNFSGESSIYECNQTSPGSCIYLNSSGNTINFNSTGNFRTSGNYVVYSGNYSTTLNLTKAQFSSKNTNGYMFYIGGRVLTNYKGQPESEPTHFNYMSAYNNPYTSITISGCYYMIRGFSL